MRILRYIALMMGLSIGGCSIANADPVVLPTDISVALSAEPSVDLQSNQRVTLTISVTNHGPQEAGFFALQSSAIYDELDVYSYTSDCAGHVTLSVADLADSFYYIFGWFPSLAGSSPPIAVGETRVCRLSLNYTPWAPPVFPITFQFASVSTDLNPDNNTATVSLRRAVTVAAPVPAISSNALALLAALLMGIGVTAVAGSKGSCKRVE